MKTTRSELALERILLALERELVNVTDDEILAAAQELGINPTMKGSAVFFGVTKRLRCRLIEDRPQQGACDRFRPKGDAPSST